MKRFALFVSCLLLICCVKPVQEQPSETAVPTAMQAETPSPVPLPEPERFPLIDAIAPLPDTVESVDLNDRLLVYVSDEICYLYLHGLSYPLFDNAKGCGGTIYNNQRIGDRFFFIDPDGGILKSLDLNDPSAPPVSLVPDSVRSVKRFMISETGDTVLFETSEDETTDALYLYRDGSAARIDESIGQIDQFYLSPDGRSLIFYMDETDTDNDRPYSDYLITDGGAPLFITGLEWISEDLQTALLLSRERKLTLLRAGNSPLVLSETCRWVEDVAPNGACWWTDNTAYETLWYFDGTETTRIGDHMDAPRVRLSGAYAYFCNGVFWAKYQNGEPVCLCLQNEFAGGGFADEHTLVFSVAQNRDEDAHAWAHRDTYSVKIDETGVTAPVLLAKDNYQTFAFLDGQLTVRSEDMSLCDLYFNDLLLGTQVRFWSDTRFSITGDTLWFISDGKLCRFDGETLKAILAIDPADDAFPFSHFSDGTLLYSDGDARYYYDGSAFHRILDHADRVVVCASRDAVARERLLHD